MLHLRHYNEGMSYLTFIAGLAILIVGANFLVKGGVSLAGRFRISTLVVGLTAISFGTSVPELVVSLNAALEGYPDISIGNVVGSNVSNIGMVLGITALIIAIPIKSRSVFFDWIVMFVACILFFFFAATGENELQRWEGIIFLSLLIIYIVYSIRKSRQTANTEPVHSPKLSLWASLLLVLAGPALLVVGSHFMIQGATVIAQAWGVSERVISITIIAFGTSVPELATSVVAAAKKELDISVGNIIGSNIFNLLGILGTTAIVTPIEVNKEIIRFDFWWMLGICILLLLFMLPVKRARLNRMNGFILVAAYLVYYYFVFIS